MRFGTLRDLARRDGMPSVASLRRLIVDRSDFPLLEPHVPGKPHLIDLDAAVTFVARFWSDGRAAVEAAEPVARRTGKLADLVGLPGMPSAPSLRRFIAAHPDFPLIQQGGRKREYLIDLDAAAAFVRLHWRDGRLERTRRREATERERSGQGWLLGDA